MITAVCIALERAQGIQYSTLEVEGRHETPSLAETLMAFDSCLEGGSDFFNNAIPCSWPLFRTDPTPKSSWEKKKTGIEGQKKKNKEEG